MTSFLSDEADRKERETLARIKAFADSIRDTGGECDCGEYGIFHVTLVDGRVFRKAGMHGWGGIFRIHRPEDPVQHPLDEIRRRVLVRAGARIEEARDARDHRMVTFYLAVSYCGNEVLVVTPEQIQSVELESEDA